MYDLQYTHPTCLSRHSWIRARLYSLDRKTIHIFGRKDINKLVPTTHPFWKKFNSYIPEDIAILAVLGILLDITWRLSRLAVFATGTTVSWWIGVAGAICMGMLILYSMRKHFKFMRNAGPMYVWFISHIILGILGPLLIMLHANFHTHSLNGAWAYYSMLIVVGSGLTGRFLFRRVNRGLHGGKTTLEAIQKDALDEEAEAYTALAFAPTVEAKLLAFEQRELLPCTWTTCLRQTLILPLRQQLIFRQCRRELWSILKSRQADNNWDNEALQLRYGVACRLTMQYLNAVVKVAQFSAYSELFALWHVIHMPFLWTLLISSIIHIFAAFAY